MKFVSATLIIALGCTTLFAQTDTLQTAGNEELPFAISDEKRLSDEDIANKKEGWYITGIPEVKYEPIKGFGLGASVFLFNNRDRSDPFFNYTPYRVRYGISARASASTQREAAFTFDVPFAFDTKWRLRGDLILEVDPNWQYFGLGEKSLRRLSFHDKRTGDFRQDVRFSQYEHNLALLRAGRGAAFGEDPYSEYTDLHYHEVIYSQYLASLGVERAYFQGRMRIMFGYEMLIIGIDHYDGREVRGAIDPETGEEVRAVQGKTLISEEYEASQRGDADSFWRRKNIAGYNGGRIGLLQSGIMWDTRDLEPDPSNGIFAEFAQEISVPAIGSEFNFSKHLLQVQFYNQLLPNYLGKTVLATRYAIGTIRGSRIPFSEAIDQWSSAEAGGVEVLGGARSLRGYREYRFTGKVYAWSNLELRSRIYHRHAFNQHFALSLVPFYDFGRAWESFGEMSLKDWRGTPGLGARIAWNLATIIRLDYAQSREGSQFFFMLGHSF